MQLIDANIFLECYLNQNSAIAAGAFLISTLDNDQPVIVTDFSIYAILLKMIRHDHLSAINTFLAFLENHPCLFTFSPVPKDLRDIFSIMKKYNLDFDDALQYYAALKHNAEIVTYDSHFSTLPNVKVLKP